MFEWICVVWGQSYRDKLLGYTLPSLLAPGNLPSWPYLSQSQLHLVSPPADWQVIQQSPVFHAVASLLHIHWTPLLVDEYPEAWGSYQVTAYVHQQALQRAHQQNSTVIFIVPDALYSNGTFSHLVQRLVQGQDLLLTLGLRVTAELFEAALPASEFVCDISPAQASQWCLQYLHPEFRSYFWFAPEFNRVSPTCSFYYNENGHVMGHSYVLTPLLIRCPLKPQNLSSTIDGGYQHLYFSWLAEHKIGVVLPEQAVVFSLTAQASTSAQWSALIPYRLRPTLVFKLLQRYYSHPLRHWYYSYSFDFGKAPELPAEWEWYEQTRPYAPWEIPELVWYLESLWGQQRYAEILAAFDQSHIRSVLEHIEQPQLWFVWHYLLQAAQARAQNQLCAQLQREYRHFLRHAQFDLARYPIAP